MKTNNFESFKEFYPFYLSQHQNKVCKLLHFFGSLFVILIFIYSIYSRQYMKLLLCPVTGYFFAWIGHYFFEKNRPATFSYPFYSLLGDWVMFKDILFRKVKIN